MDDKLYTIKKYKKDSIICMENSKALPCFFIIKTGQVTKKLFLTDKEDITIYREGDTFGLISCMTDQQYLERITASTDCQLIIVKKENIIPFLMTKKNIFVKIISDYSNRLRDLDFQLKSKTCNSVYTQMPEVLLDIAEYFKKQQSPHHYFYAISKYVQYASDDEKKSRYLAEIEKIKQNGKMKLKEPEVFNNRMIYHSGDIIFLEQEQSDNFYFIEKGKVKISHINGEKDYILAILNEGEFFGEMSILNKVERSACAIAFEDTRLLSLNRNTFLDHLPEKILINIFKSIAKRMWFSYRRYINYSYSYPVTRLYDYLDLIITARETKKKEYSCHLDISLDDLKSMSNTAECSDGVISEFLSDDNLTFSYGNITIHNLNSFYEAVKLYTYRERGS
ncbi:MAG: cyclic nucleotide-binding domain-containing protein [Spirochaetes bacterium]|nr:cyclic nucleotide-binding domain-containing protein [Spirochaetota bacterium]